MNPEPLLEGKSWYTFRSEILEFPEGREPFQGLIEAYFKEDVQAACKLLEKELGILCTGPPLTFDEFVKIKKRIIKYCFPDAHDE